MRKRRTFVRRFLRCIFHQHILVRVARFELTASWSRTMRATNCATPGYEIVRLTPRTVVLYELPSVLSRGKSTFFKKPRGTRPRGSGGSM